MWLMQLLPGSHTPQSLTPPHPSGAVPQIQAPHELRLGVQPH
jgi:hypothetical protein